MVIRKRLLFFAVSILLSSSLTIVSSAQADYINLAPVYGGATANSLYYGGIYGGTPELAIDGDINTQWNAGTWANLGAPLWLIVNLNNSFDVDRVILYGTRGNAGTHYYERFLLYGSTDGESWYIIGGGSLIDTPSLNRAEISMTPVSLQYIKFEVTEGTHWGHLNEMEIYGNTASVPEPAMIYMMLLSIGPALAVAAGVRRKTKKD